MSASLSKQILKLTVLITPWLLALLLALGWGLASWTPGYLERLVPELADEIGLPLTEFHIRDAGLFSADIGPVRLGAEDTGLKLRNVHVTYTPASLRMGRVNEVVLDGVSLRCEYDGESFKLPIMDLLPTSEDGKSTSKALPDLPLDSIVIQNSILLCVIEGKDISIPFAATITPGESYVIDGRLTPRDQSIVISATLGPTMDDLAIEATSRTRLGAFNDLMTTPVNGTAHVDIKATVNLSQPDSLNAEILTEIKDLNVPDSGVVFDPEYTVSAKTVIEGRSIDFALRPTAIIAPYPAILSIPKGRASTDSLSADFTLTTAGVTLPGSFKADREGDQWALNLNTGNPDAMTVDTGGRAIRLAGFSCAVTGTASADAADIVINTSTRGTTLDSMNLRTGPVRLSLPLAWPAPKHHTSGTLTVSGLRYDTYTLGMVSAKIRQEAMGLAIDGTLFTQLLPDLRVPFSGSASMESKEASFTFDIAKYPLPDGFDPASLVPALKGVDISGVLIADGGVNIRDGDIESRLGLFFTDATFAMGGEGGTTISGIRLFFESPDLLNFRSAPAQMLAFDSLTAGPLSLDKGVITFQLEPGGVVLVERMGFDWCEGHVASRAFRVVPGHDEYDVTLFCSELKLSSLLGQLGLANAKGEAALSGELPVTWKNGKISFNNGFLHSTPGQGGTIQVNAMQDLVSTMPRGTPQRGQLELAQAAIKDFEYKWVRIKADTVGEELLVRLSLDGKPVGTLPFIYKKEFGGFARVTGDVQGSNFQGLRLDVNFSLPLDRILLYKDIIEMIE
ncbi:YdbH domain-containing protein [Pseudodesulfovibrio sp.]|nr:YdbH domain-containing protein [Pseudodesulfovibrio sp.]